MSDYGRRGCVRVGELSEIPQKVVEQKRGEGKQRVKKGRASWVKR